MLNLMCLEKDTNFVQMTLRSVGKCTGMVPIENCRIICQYRLILYMEYMRIWKAHVVVGVANVLCNSYKLCKCSSNPPSRSVMDNT